MPEFDVLVIGGGAAGLRAAIAARLAGASVGLISKVHPLRTNSGLAQGGINAPLGKDDSPELFAKDTVTAGDELSEPNIARTFAGEAAKDVIWLERMGVPFNRDAGGRLDRRDFGSNSRRRSCYADDRTGYIVLQVLHEQFQRQRIPSFEEWFVTSLAMDDGVCAGAIALNLRTGKLDAFGARAVILATGGFTRLYHPCTASLGTTGDGQALALRAGARLMDMEMVQYHPTVFAGPHPLLITEATLGEGAQIVDGQGHPIAETRGMTRERLCSAIHAALANGGNVFLDLRPIGKEKLLSRFPQTHELAREVAGLDPTKELVPIRPAAHRPMGGIQASDKGETALTSLFAAGECACNGLNGAGRLSGNTLAEAVVFGRRAGATAAAHAKSGPAKKFPATALSDEEKRLGAVVGGTGGNGSTDGAGKIYSELARLMSEKVGAERDARGLEEALERIGGLKERHAKLRVKNSSRIYNYELTSHLELGSLLTLGEAVARSALSRTESRGAHHRTDFPRRDDENWRRHTVASLVKGSLKLETKALG